MPALFCRGVGSGRASSAAAPVQCAGDGPRNNGAQLAVGLFTRRGEQNEYRPRSRWARIWGERGPVSPNQREEEDRDICMPLICYPASKVKWADTVWKPLRAALAPLDIHLSGRWLDWPQQDNAEKTDQHWRDHWTNIREDVLACNVLIFMSLQGERACSALIETGIALSRGVPVLCVSPDFWSFSHLPQVRRYTHLGPAIEALIAMAAELQR